MKSKFLLIIIATSLVFTSCKDYLDVNDDPNNPTSVPINNVIPAAQTQVVGYVGGSLSILGGIWTQCWAQSNASSQYVYIDEYNVQPTDFNIQWRDAYSGTLNDLKYVLEKAEAEQNWTAYLIATSLTAYTYQMLVDLYDKVPYTEALKADEGVLQPKADNGQDIYDDLITKIDAALAKDFSNAGSVQIPTDLFFGSKSKDAQIEAWKKFANTLKLRLYLRQSKVRPSVATAGINSVLSSPIGLLDEDAGISSFLDQDSKSNPLFEDDRRQLNTTTNIRGSKTFIDTLVSSNDPRIVDYFSANSGGIYVGLPQGGHQIPSTTINPSTISVMKVGATDPFYLFSVEQVYFMLSEAHLLLGNSSEAKSAYESGISTSFDRYGYDASAFLASGGDYEWDGSLGKIMVAKWFSMPYNAIEVFFDFRKNGFPSFFNTSLTSKLPSGKYPARLPYPLNETRINANLPANVSIDMPVWWDVDGEQGN